MSYSEDITKKLEDVDLSKSEDNQEQSNEDQDEHSGAVALKPKTEKYKHNSHSSTYNISPRDLQLLDLSTTRFNSNRLLFVFNQLSAMINQGCYSNFYYYYDKFVDIKPVNYDLTCMLLYLESCVYMFHNNKEKCKNTIDKALKCVPMTKSPNQFFLDISSLMSWQCLNSDDYINLKKNLSDAFQIIHQDPVSTKGKSTGWNLINEARGCMPFIKGDDIDSVRMYEKTVIVLKRACDHFKFDVSKDGPFGFYFSSLKLAILYLKCGDHLQTIDILKPTMHELISAKEILENAEKCDYSLPDVLKMTYYLAKSDLSYRECNFCEALEFAMEAVSLCRRCKMMKEIEMANLRVTYLTKK